MDAETLTRIRTFLEGQGQALESIPKSRLVQLEKVDSAIQKRLASIAEARNTLRNCCINVSTIAADSGISRKTFYNNDILRLYVERYANDSETPALTNEVQRLKIQNEQYKAQIDAFLVRDIETENLRHENIKLAMEIANLQVRNKNLEERCAALVRKEQMPRSGLAKESGTVIQLPKPD